LIRSQLKKGRFAALFLWNKPLFSNVLPNHRIGLTLLVAMAACLLLACYLPGLHGVFLFDDAVNLPNLGAYGPVDNRSTFLRYITSGRADPTGRPLSLFSFLIDARDWPADPFVFKRTNLILHGFNAALLSLVLAWMGRLQGLPRARADVSAVLAAMVWALHPFFVSTVLYVVQREAMLPATLTLIGLLCWLRARDRDHAGPIASWTWLILGVGGCTVLATLSKANGLLLPLLVLTCEATLPPSAPEFRAKLRVTMLPPAIAITAYVAWTAISAIGQGPIAIRGWSVWQRLITEPSVLLDYLAQLWLFKPTDSSLFHDGAQAAASLWSPWCTLPAIIACGALIAAGWKLRRGHPYLALAILFFFAGHLLESSSLALELYFDHRNYLPAMPMFWALAVTVTGHHYRLLSRLTAAMVVLAISMMTFSNTTLWGQPLAQATEWAKRHPESARAQAYAVQMDMAAGRMALARRRIDAASARFAGEPQIAVNLIDVHCATGGLAAGDIDYAKQTFRVAQREPGPLLLNWFTRVVASRDLTGCKGLSDEALEDILSATEENPRIAALPGRRQDIDHIRGLMALGRGNSETALIWFNRALAEYPNPAAALEQAASLGSAGDPALGLAHLEYFSRLPAPARHRISDGMPWIHDYVLERQRYWDGEIAHLSKALELHASAPK
jgi:tetratricopeptide (TPR) repeat protein